MPISIVAEKSACETEITESENNRNVSSGTSKGKGRRPQETANKLCKGFHCMISHLHKFTTLEYVYLPEYPGACQSNQRAILKKWQARPSILYTTSC